MVTHDPVVAKRADLTLHLEKGLLVESGELGVTAGGVGVKFRGLIFANLFRKKLRLILTIGSFAIALVLFTFLAVVKKRLQPWHGNRRRGPPGGRQPIGLMQLMPISIETKILSIPGVKAVTQTTGSAVSIRMKRTSFPSCNRRGKSTQGNTELVVPGRPVEQFREKTAWAPLPAPAPPRASIGKSAIASPSNDSLWRAALQSSISTAFITASVPAETKPILAAVEIL